MGDKNRDITGDLNWSTIIIYGQTYVCRSVSFSLLLSGINFSKILFLTGIQIIIRLFWRFSIATYLTIHCR